MKSWPKQIWILALAIIVFIVLTYSLVQSYVLDQVEKRLRDTMLECKAFHHYVQRDMHPAYYKLMQEKRLADGFYAPELLSSSYIARIFQQYYNQERRAAGLPPVHYKMAAIDPRNEVNKATEYEARLIAWFNEDKSRTHFNEVIREDGKKYLLYARPFLVTRESCLKCHGEPEHAPVDLVSIYNWQGGWNRKVGDIFAAEIVRTPLSGEYDAAMTFFGGFILVLGAGMFLFVFNSRLRGLVTSRTLKIRENEKRLKNIYRILSAIRNVNQLITREKDRKQLLKETCRILVESNGFHNAWIGLVKDGKPDGSVYHAGFNGNFASIEKQLKTGQLPYCGLLALKNDSVQVVDNPALHCQSCELSHNYVDRVGFTVRLEHEATIYGWLTVSAPLEFAHEAEELSLFAEVAQDIAFALHKLDVEEQHRQSVLELDASEKKYRTYVENAANGIFISNAEGVYVDVNPAACDMLGYEREELIGMSISQIISPTDVDSAMQHFKLLKNTGRMDDEFTLIKKDGSTIYITLCGVKIDDFRYMAVCNNITEQKEAERALQESIVQQQEAVKAGNVGLWDWDLITNKVRYSKEWKAQIGYKDHEIDNDFTEWQSRVHPDDLAETENQIRVMIDQLAQEYQVVFRFRHKAGHYIWILAQASVIADESGKPIRVLGSHVDITDRKKVEDALRISEEKHRALYENAPLSYQSLDENGHILDVNPAWLRALGYDLNEVIGHYFSDFLHPDWQPHFAKNFPEFKKHGYVSDVQFRLRHKAGHYIDVSFEGCIGYHPDGSFRQTYCVFQNITERKQAEIALHSSKERNRILLEFAGHGIGYFDSDGNCMLINQKACEYMQTKPEELIGKNMLELYGAELGEKYVKRIKDTIQAGVSNIYEDKVDLPYNTAMWFESTYTAMQDGVGKITGVQIISVDITARKQAELDRIINERKLKLRSKIAENFVKAEGLEIFHQILYLLLKQFNSRFGYFGYIDKDGDLVCPSMTYDIWDQCEMPGKSIVFPREQWGGMWGESLAKQKNIIQNEGLNVPNGHIELNNAMAVVIQIDEQLIGHVVLANQEGGFDQTDLDMMSEISHYIAPLLLATINELEYKDQLQQNEEKYRNLFNNINAGVALHEIVTDDKGKPVDFIFMDANPMYEELTQLKIDDIRGKLGRQVIPNLEQKWIDRCGKVALTGEAMEIVDYTENLDKYWNLRVYSPQHGQFAVVLIDITEQKKAEIAFEKYVAKITGIFKAAPIGIVVMTNRKFSEVNDRFCEIVGYSKDELIDQNARMLYESDDEYEHLGKINYTQIKETGVGMVETRFVRKDGRIVDVLLSSTILDPNNPEAGFATTCMDITQRKRAEVALQKSEMLLEMSQQLSHIGGWEWYADDQSMFWTEEVYRIHEIDHDEMELGSPEHTERSIACYKPDDRPVILGAFERCYTEGEPYDLEFLITTVKGNQRRIRTMAKPVYEDGKIVKLVGNVMDITEKYMIEQQYQSLFDKMIDGFALHEIICDEKGKPVDYRFLEINPSFERLTGLSRDVIGKTVHKVIPGTEQYWIDIYGKVALTGEPITFENYSAAIDKHFKVTAYRPAPMQFACIFVDITAQKKASDEIQKNLKEKEILLKEIHHRVKNNMQVIISLLNLQAEKIKDRTIIDLFEDSRKRIYTMALVHEQLYKSENLSKIEMQPYLQTISRDLHYSYATETEVLMDLQIKDVWCDINQAIPCGLLFNELITNSLKHAFKGRIKGQLYVSFDKIDTEYEVIVRDDGKGIPQNLDVNTASSLGLKLVTILSKQLGGKLTINREKGTEIKIQFPEEG